MTAYSCIKSCLRLLAKTDQKKFVVAALIQMLTALLDLAGILILGLVSAMSVSIFGGGQPPRIAESAMNALGFSKAPTASQLLLLAAIAVFLLLFKSVINAVLTRRVLKFLSGRQADIAGRLAAKILNSSLIEIQGRSSQETAYALTEGVNHATLIVLGLALVLCAETALIVVLGVGLLLVSPVVTVFAILFFLAVGVIAHRLLANWASKLGQASLQAELQSYVLIQESMASFREITVTSRRGFYVKRFESLRWQAAYVQSDLQFLKLVPKFIFEVALVIGSLLLAGSQLLWNDASTAISVIVVFLVAGSRVVPSLLRLQNAYLTVRATAGVISPTLELANEFDIGNEETAKSKSRGGHRPATGDLAAYLVHEHSGFKADLSIVEATFTFPGSLSPALSGANLYVPEGTSVALVGLTGAGKSTLADVALGVLSPQKGAVLVGGLHPLEAAAKWPGAIAYVPQDVSMLNGSVRENVALGIPGALIEDAAVWAALEHAHLANFLREQRNGLDTQVGESGVQLSGGQRQRLGIARALYAKPRFLVLDEATSALDAETERAIAATISSLHGEATVITIAHRLATIQSYDLVVYLENGRIAAAGTFDAVRSQIPAFDNQARLLGL